MTTYLVNISTSPLEVPDRGLKLSPGSYLQCTTSDLDYPDVAHALAKGWLVVSNSTTGSPVLTEYTPSRVIERRPQGVVLLNCEGAQVGTTNRPLEVALSSGNVTLEGPVTVANQVEITNDIGNPIPVVLASTAPMPVQNNAGLLNVQALQVVQVTSASAQSASVSASTTRCVLASDTDCWVALGSNPTAQALASGNIFLPANVQSYPIAVTPGVTKIAVLKHSAEGHLSIIEAS